MKTRTLPSHEETNTGEFPPAREFSVDGADPWERGSTPDDQAPLDAPLEQERSRAVRVNGGILEVDESIPRGDREDAQRKVLVYVALIVGICAFTWLGKTLSFVFTPLLAAWFVCHLILPLIHWLDHKGVPRVFGHVAAFSVVMGVFAAMGAIATFSVTKFRSNIGTYQENIDHWLGMLSQFVEGMGFLKPGERLSVAFLIDALPEGGAMSIITSGTTLAYELIAFSTATLFILIFMIWEAESFAGRIWTAYGFQRGKRIIEVGRKFNRDVGRYVVLKVAVSALTGILAYGVLMLFEIHFAPLLALLVFLLNFIPYVGSVLSTVAPTLVAFAQLNNIEDPLLVCGSIILIHQLLGNVLEPKLQGRSLNLSPVLILVTLVYFGWMWGIVGMIVSVPLTSGICLVLEEFEVTRPFARLVRES